MKIALLPNLTRSHALSVTDDVCKYLEKYNAEYYFETETAEKICHKIKAVGLPETELLSLCDVVIAIGGDSRGPSRRPCPGGPGGSGWGQPHSRGRPPSQ